MPTPVIADPDAIPRTNPPPLTIQEALNTVATYTSYSITQDSQLVVVGPNNPVTEDQSKVWLRTSPCGIPLGWYRWNTCALAWYPVITGLPGEIRMFCGDPTLYFDTTGLGITTAEWTGWALCNGSNGTPNMLDKFICSGQAVSGQFLAYFDNLNNGVTSGGNASLTIQLYNIPVLTSFCPFHDGFQIGSPQQYAYPQGGGADNYTYSIAAVGTGPQTPVSLLPPFIAQGYVMWRKGPC
jgi:hypothetical protein